MQAADAGRRATIWGLMILLAMACARIEAPPGGPPDREAPTIRESRPASGSVNLDTRPEFRFEFDEWVNRASLSGELYLSPRHEGGLELNWVGRTLKARPVLPLDSGRTYLLEMGTGVRDLAGNRLASPHRIAFSTGASLDSFAFAGWIGGYRPNAKVMIWAWPLDSFPVRPLAPAPWQTRPDSSGGFRLLNLPETAFRLFAINDLNGDGRWSPATEPAALASADPAPGGYGNVRPSLYLSELELDSLALTAVQPEDRHHLLLEGRLDLPGRPGRAAQLSLLELADTLGRQIPLLTLREEEDGRYLLVCGEMDSLTYWLRFKDGSDSVSFRGLAYTQNPFQGFERPVRLDSKRRLHWLPPRGLKTQARTAAWVGQGSDSEAVVPQFLDALELVWGLPRARAGDTLFLSPGIFEGMAGDTWPASLARFALELPPDVEHGALQLLFVPAPPANTPWRIQLRMGETLLSDRELVSPLELAELPAGWLSAELYFDRNGDGEWTAGQLEPFRHAEARLPLTDSLQVYPGWTREGLELQLPEELSQWNTATP
ncbi:MAG: Ig-like domain-containing protein [Calditrichaeota bacterium]|nr:Ig-like domain-containing protein [Calditrichota bacterium]MCB9474647.1 Ig-like domain-containing protein [Candidatus Delongbacteria bacterium]